MQSLGSGSLKKRVSIDQANRNINDDKMKVVVCEAETTSSGDHDNKRLYQLTLATLDRSTQQHAYKSW